MTTSEDFVNWLEGFLDACKNAPTSQQIKEVRKKISLIRQATTEQYNSLWDPTMQAMPTSSFSTITLVQPPKEEAHLKHNEPLNEDFIRAIEENKTASTMEELNS
jgi:hypothetical protein